MKYIAFVNVLPLDEILDPQGKTTEQSLHQLGYENLSEIRVGKRIRLEVTAESRANAQEVVEAAARRLLSNPVIEQFEIELVEA